MHTALEPGGSTLLLTVFRWGRKKSREQDVFVPGVPTPDAAAAAGTLPAVTTLKLKAKYRVGEEDLPVLHFPQCATGTEDSVATTGHHNHGFSPQR